MAVIHAAAFPAEYGWDASFFAEQLSLPGRFGFLHPDGGMILARIVADESEIMTIAVAPPVQRHGIGRWLLKEAAQHAMRYGARAMFLEVAANNQAAQALYRACDFTEIGRRPAYYPDGQDALVLRAALIPAVIEAW
jgi:ribosomal-protein-alanine N-acetyltransferase